MLESVLFWTAVPSSPFFKGGIFLRGISDPSLKKRGKGRFLDGMTLELWSELLGQ